MCLAQVVGGCAAECADSSQLVSVYAHGQHNIQPTAPSTPCTSRTKGCIEQAANRLSQPQCQVLCDLTQQQGKGNETNKVLHQHMGSSR